MEIEQENCEIATTTSDLRLARQAIMTMQKIAQDGHADRRTEILHERPSGIPEHVYLLNFAQVVIV